MSELHRIRAHMRFTVASGLATWCRDNMQVRFEQAVHVNEGLANEEPKRNEVTDHGSHEEYHCDLPLMDEAHAIDAFNTLSDANVLGQSLAIPDEDGARPSWVERHTCHHEQVPVQPCTVNALAEGPE